MWQALRICEIILVRKSRILIVWYCLRNTIYCFWFEHIIFIFHNSFHTVFVHSETRNWKNKLVKKFNLKKNLSYSLFCHNFFAIHKGSWGGSSLDIAAAPTASITECGQRCEAIHPSEWYLGCKECIVHQWESHKRTHNILCGMWVAMMMSVSILWSSLSWESSYCKI